MSLINFRPHMMDDFGPYRPLRLFDRESLPSSLNSAYEYEEDENEVRFSVDMPGIKVSDLDVSVDNGYLNISGSRSIRSADGKAVKKARYARTFSLNEDSTDLSKLKANLADGVLVVTVPKKTKQKAPTKIVVTTDPQVEKIEMGKEEVNVKPTTGNDSTKSVAGSVQEATDEHSK